MEAVVNVMRNVIKNYQIVVGAAPRRVAPWGSFGHPAAGAVRLCVAVIGSIIQYYTVKWYSSKSCFINGQRARPDQAKGLALTLCLSPGNADQSKAAAAAAASSQSASNEIEVYRHR